jgi:hypothetical protein
MGKREHVYLSVFVRYFNILTPVAPIGVLQKAIQTINIHHTDTLSSERRCALIALLWSCVGCGAALLREPHAPAYLSFSREYLRHCYDSPSYETLCALASTAIASFHINPSLFFLYMNFATAVFIEVRDRLSRDQLLPVLAALQYLRSLTSEVHPSGQVNVISYLDAALQSHVLVHSNGVLEEVQLGDDTRLARLYNIVNSLLRGFTDACGYEPSLSNDARGPLKHILRQCNVLKREGFVHEIDRIAMLYANCRMFAYSRLNQFRKAQGAALSALKTIVGFPVFATFHRKGTIAHAMLDVMEILGPEEQGFRERIAEVRDRCPMSDMVEGLTTDREEAFLLKIKFDVQTMHYLVYGPPHSNVHAPCQRHDGVDMNAAAAAARLDYHSEMQFDEHMSRMLEEALGAGRL